jgi:hypothetical protein
MRSRSCDFWPSRAAPQLEQLALACDRGGDVELVGARQQSGRKVDLLGLVALASQLCLAGGHLVETLGDDGEVGSRDGLLEAQHDLAAAHVLPVAHQQFAYDAADQVLHLLDVGVDHDRSLSDDRAGQFGGGRPAADADRQHQGDDRAVGQHGDTVGHPTPPGEHWHLTSCRGQSVN